MDFSRLFYQRRGISENLTKTVEIRSFINHDRFVNHRIIIPQRGTNLHYVVFTPARDFLLETPWRIIIPNPNVNSHSL
jgi:hypothetical protein